MVMAFKLIDWTILFKMLLFTLLLHMTDTKHETRNASLLVLGLASASYIVKIKLAML